MAIKIAVASGKGGTGKTTVSVNLFHLLSRDAGEKVVLVDCDVEEPNDVIFFPGARKLETLRVHQEIPVIDASKCIFCRKCSEYCEFNAILVMPPVKFAEVNPALCHSCGACMVACDQGAIWVKEQEIGIIHRYTTGEGKGIMEGNLNIGSAMQTMVIRELKKSLPPDSDILLFDAPPGTSCPVVETISDADYVLLVAEPTPFGLHDLKLMVSLVTDMEIPFGVVISKAGTGSNKIYGYLRDEGIELLAEIPFSLAFAVRYSSGQLFDQPEDEITGAFRKLADRVLDKVRVS
jgi:MinD superfamily P-loop ATPase